MSSLDEDSLTPKETAALCKVTERTVRRWIKRGILRVEHVGYRIRVPRSSLSAMVNRKQLGQAATN